MRPKGNAAAPKGCPIWLKITLHWSKAAAPDSERWRCRAVGMPGWRNDEMWCQAKVQWRVDGLAVSDALRGGAGRVELRRWLVNTSDKPHLCLWLAAIDLTWAAAVPVIYFTRQRSAPDISASQPLSNNHGLACQLGGQRYCYAYYTRTATEMLELSPSTYAADTREYSLFAL